MLKQPDRLRFVRQLELVWWKKLQTQVSQLLDGLTDLGLELFRSHAFQLSDRPRPWSRKSDKVHPNAVCQTV
jgi:hypothetical protein